MPSFENSNLKKYIAAENLSMRLLVNQGFNPLVQIVELFLFLQVEHLK